MIWKTVAVLATAGAVLVPTAHQASAQPEDTTTSSSTFEVATPQDAGWTPVAAANGSVAVVPGAGPAGSSVLRMRTPDYTSGSISYVRRTLPAPTYGLSATGTFKVNAGGCDGTAGYSAGNVPFFRFFDAKANRVVGLVRINGSCSKMAKLYVQHSGNYWRTGKNIGFGDWNRLELRAVVSTPSASLVQVWVNGQKVYETTIADNGAAAFTSVTMHNEHSNQVGDLYADDVVLADVAGGGPVENPCDATAAPPGNDFPGRTVLADGFESGNLTAWSAVEREGDATAVVGTAYAFTPSCGVRLHVTSNTGSRTNLTKTHDAGTRELWLDGRFRVAAEGVSGSNVPFWRIFSGTTRVVDVYRANGSGQLYLRTTNAAGSATFTSLGRVLALGSWHRVRAHVVDAGATSTVQVWLGDQQLLDATMSLWDGDLRTSMVGSEHYVQVMDLDVDDVVIKQP